MHPPGIHPRNTSTEYIHRRGGSCTRPEYRPRDQSRDRIRVCKPGGCKTRPYITFWYIQRTFSYGLNISSVNLFGQVNEVLLHTLPKFLMVSTEVYVTFTRLAPLTFKRPEKFQQIGFDALIPHLFTEHFSIETRVQHFGEISQRIVIAVVLEISLY